MTSETKGERMGTFELEIPGRLNWRFDDEDEAVRRAAKLMVSSVNYANLYAIGDGEIRLGLVLLMVKSGEICPECKCDDGLIELSGMLERFDELSICRNCERLFRT